MFIIYSPKPITVSKTTVTHAHVVTFQRMNKSVKGNLISVVQCINSIMPNLAAHITSLGSFYSNFQLVEIIS